MYNFSPYLFFDGNCGEAMAFYKQVFGGELNITRVQDSPMKNSRSEKDWQQVIHSQLKSGPIDISASDWLNPARERKQGNTICLMLSNSTYDELKVIFDKLLDGAMVIDALRNEFFGVYGALTDKFGVRWMFQGNLPAKT